MELKLIRETKTSESTIGKLYINDVFECFILEDTDRGLNQNMPLDQLIKLKKQDRTAIPEGRYEIAITFSNRFQQYMPILLSVPAYEGIRIHAGNTHLHTEGCLLPGETKKENIVLNSRKAYRQLFSKLRKIEKKEKMFITISSIKN